MSPQIETRIAPRSLWFSPAECQSYYKKPYAIREIQIHWWDDPSRKPTHDGIVSYGMRRTEGSVNYVASAGRITKMVEEDNCALTTQGGNPYGIKIECSPYGTDADYQTIAWLVADIWRRRGYLPLVPHNRYWQTTCPGSLNLARIEQLAKTMIGGKGGGTVARDALSKEDVIEIHRAYFIGDPGPGYGWEHVGQPLEKIVNDWKNSGYRQAVLQRYYAFDTLSKQVADLTKLAEELRKNPTAEAYKQLQDGLQACTVQANAANAEVEKYKAEKAADEQTGNAFLRWLAGLFRRSQS